MRSTVANYLKLFILLMSPTDSTYLDSQRMLDLMIVPITKDNKYSDTDIRTKVVELLQKLYFRKKKKSILTIWTNLPIASNILPYISRTTPLFDCSTSSSYNLDEQLLANLQKLKLSDDFNKFLAIYTVDGNKNRELNKPFLNAITAAGSELCTLYREKALLEVWGSAEKNVFFSFFSNFRKAVQCYS